MQVLNHSWANFFHYRLTDRQYTANIKDRLKITYILYNLSSVDNSFSILLSVCHLIFITKNFIQI